MATLRRAEATDATAIASLFIATCKASLPYLPDLHTDAETHAWVAGVVLRTCDVRVAEAGGAIIGFMVLAGDSLEHLYVLPGQQRHGIGRALLGQAKALSPRRLRLFVFQKNAVARAFYRANGFVECDFSDGAGNEEHEPDLRCVWSPTAP